MKTNRTAACTALLTLSVFAFLMLSCESRGESYQTVASQSSEDPCDQIWRETFNACYSSCENSATWGCVVLLWSYCAEEANQKKGLCCLGQPGATIEGCST